MARTLYLEEKKGLFAKQCFFSKPVSLHVHVFISLLKFNRSRHFTCYPSSQLTNWLDAPPEVSIASKERQHSVPGLGKAPLSSFPHIGITAGDETSTVPAAQSLVQLSTVRDRDPLGASPRPRTESLHFLDHVHSLLHAAKDNMLAIQPKRRQQEVYYHGPGLRDDPSCTQLGGTLGSRRHYSCNALLGRH